ncbi:MAG: hypothetical protein KGL39_13165 [Patescibacteria group bacterium]|nr:hypothetical protein [Patescibacteria group bacterium]
MKSDSRKSKRKSKQKGRGTLAATAGSASALSFKKLFADAERYRRERILKAGKHECVRELAGTVSRVTGRGDKILKRPVVQMRFYECKLCGRDMTPNAGTQRREKNI